MHCKGSSRKGNRLLGERLAVPLVFLGLGADANQGRWQPFDLIVICVTENRPKNVAFGRVDKEL